MKKIMKRVALVLTCLPAPGYACEVCRSRQPAALSGITHGSGPQGNADYMIIWGAAVIVGIALFLSIKYLVKPQESAPDHIKNIIIG